jgi:cellulose synthase/poly-beta-1,6-N-acetylglucosamine synthase-like glycosyltransferase
MRVDEVDDPEWQLALALAEVEQRNPGATARPIVTRSRPWRWVIAGALLVGLVVLAPVAVAVTFTTLASVLYTVTVWHRISLVRRALRHDPAVHVSDAEARAVPDDELPVYSVLIPAYGEPEILPGLLEALERLEYPRDRLDVVLLLEADDDDTIAAARAIDTDLPVRVLLVPPGEPRTKPRALDFGLRFAHGDLVTIYDAEDHPEPLQLRRAAEAFRRAGDEVVCLQARLFFYGGHRNLLTRWFTTEYATWFHLYLPGLVLADATVPLGGTSNHFRRWAIDEVGGWDPWNVTEDCDLGIRLQRRGWRIGILDSVTMEEPNTDVLNWVKQRSRWYKGYLQTFQVAWRHPRSLVHDLGWRGVFHFVMFVGCTPLLAVMNLWFWGLALVWITTRAAFVQAMYPGWAYYLAAAVWVIGNLSVVYVSVVTARVVRRPDLLAAAVLSPLYWVLMSIAALRAAVQLVTAPSHWEKTTHGLTLVDEVEGRADPSIDRSVHPGLAGRPR